MISPGTTWEGTQGALGGAMAEMIADSAWGMRTPMADRVLDLPRQTRR
jgi:hypothetical protein